MLMHPGEIWNCSNSTCHGSVEVRKGTYGEGANPRCSCGGIMKKEYRSPVFRYLDFLRLDDNWDEPLCSANSARKERGK